MYTWAVPSSDLSNANWNSLWTNTAQRKMVEADKVPLRLEHGVFSRACLPMLQAIEGRFEFLHEERTFV